MLRRPPPSVPASQLLICVWVSLSLSVPNFHLSELPPEHHPPTPQTPELRAPTRTLTKEVEFEKLTASEPRGCPLIPFNHLDKTGETEAQFEKGEKSTDKYKCHHLNPGQPFPSWGWRLQFPRDEMSDPRVGGELPQPRKQAVTQIDLGQGCRRKGNAGETGTKVLPS